MKWRLGILTVAAGAVVLAMTRTRSAPVEPWRAIAPGVQMRTLTVGDDGTPAPRGTNVVALRTTASRIHVAAGSTLDSGGWRAREQAIAALNGGFFDPSGRPVGLCISHGTRVNGRGRAHDGIFVVRHGRAAILASASTTRESLQSATEALECGPRLVFGGSLNRLKMQWARRSGVGIQRDGQVVVAISDGQLSLPAWAEVWAHSDALNCIDALNLDGGPSTQMTIEAPSRMLQVPGGWPVPDAIVIRSRAE